MAEPVGYQPRSMFAQMLQQRQGERTQALVAKTLNEEIEAGIGGQTNVNLAETLPQAYFSAARRIAALGNATEAQQLYQAGVAAIESTSKHNATLNELRASADNMDEAPSEYLEAMRKRDELAAQLPNFAESTPTGQAMRRTLSDLEARMERLNASGSTAALPDNLVEWEQYNASLIADGQQPIPYYKFHNEERMTARDPQAYRAYVEGERAAGRTPVSYERWTPGFQGQVRAGTDVASGAVKGLLEQQSEAYGAIQELNSIRNSLNFVNEGLRTGTASNWRQFAARATATLFGDDPTEATVNTDAYIASSAPRVVQIVRALAPVTDQDKAYIQQAVGGDLSAVTEPALRRILELAAQTATGKINRFNENLANLGDEYETVAGSVRPIEAPKIDFGAPATRSTKPIAEMSTEELEAELRSLSGP